MALAKRHVLMAYMPRFTLDGDNLVTCLQNSPSCAAMFFEYAKEFTAAVKKSLGFQCSHGEHWNFARSEWFWKKIVPLLEWIEYMHLKWFQHAFICVCGDIQYIHTYLRIFAVRHPPTPGILGIWDSWVFGHYWAEHGDLLEKASFKDPSEI